MLPDETVSVERRPVADARPVPCADFLDKVFEMTETDEKAVVSETARVKEEVVIRKDVANRTETIRDNVRHEEVEITKAPAAGVKLDPESHDPPPRHTEASGASLAVRAGILRLASGVPAIASGEDRAFVRLLWMMDAKVRHDPAIQVMVSGRIVGRAQGGWRIPSGGGLNGRMSFPMIRLNPLRMRFGGMG